MAILKQGENEVEVRIRRDSDGTYFDEYVKIGDRDTPDGRECERYIAGEPGATYSVEITLKNGYDFGKCKAVQAQLHFPGNTKKAGIATIYAPPMRKTLDLDHTMAISSTKFFVGRRAFEGAKFAFQEINMPERSETGLANRFTAPKDLGAFTIQVTRINKFSKWAQKDENRVRAAESSLIAFLEGKQKLEATNIDADECQKQGIIYDIGLTGGAWMSHQHKRKAHHKAIDRLTFRYLSRCGESFEPLGIVPYPPPLYCYAWVHLSESDRKIGLKELQELAIVRARENLELRTGQLLPRRSRGLNEGDPSEWRPWGLMAAWEKKKAFETLQEENKDYERAKTQKQIVGVPDEQLVAVEDDKVGELKPLVSPVNGTLFATIAKENDQPSGKDANSSRGTPASDYSAATEALSSQANTSSSQASVEEPSQAAEASSGPASETIPALQLPALEPSNVKFEIKEESIEEASRPPKRRRVEITINDEDDDGEIKRMEAEERKLLEEIEEAERLAKLKRKREALHEKIQAAKARKLQK